MISYNTHIGLRQRLLIRRIYNAMIMIKLGKRLIFPFIVWTLLINIAYSQNQVLIEFLYMDPSEDPWFCQTCPSHILTYQDFLKRNETLNEIQQMYSDRVLISWTKYDSPEGLQKREYYNVYTVNSMVIKSPLGQIVKIEGAFNETYLREVIDAFLAEEPSPPQSTMHIYAALSIAFTFGFLETFSPCLIILLSFVLSYTIEKMSQPKEKFLQVMAFGIGFISATLLILSLVFAGLIVFTVVPTLHSILMLFVCVFAILFGLNLLGLKLFSFATLKFDTKLMIQKISKKYAFTYIGLFTLGFIFYFLDPCIAPIFGALMITFEPVLLFNNWSLIILVFSVGVLIPFVGFGIFAGSISWLTRSTYRHRFKVRALSGLILVAYAVYLIFTRFLL